MNTSAIDTVLEQIRAYASQASGKAEPADVVNHIETNFAQVLKGAIDNVNKAQMQAGQMAKAFELGESSVNLQDVVIAMQKANISFQTMIQVRNKVVAAYHDIMNMQV